MQDQLYNRTLSELFGGEAGVKKRFVGGATNANEKFGRYWSRVKRKRKPKERAIMWNDIIDSLWKSLLQTYKVIFSKHRAHEE